MFVIAVTIRQGVHMGSESRFFKIFSESMLLDSPNVLIKLLGPGAAEDR